MLGCVRKVNNFASSKCCIANFQRIGLEELRVSTSSFRNFAPVRCVSIQTRMGYGSSNG